MDPSPSKESSLIFGGECLIADQMTELVKIYRGQKTLDASYFCSQLLYIFQLILLLLVIDISTRHCLCGLIQNRCV